MQFNFKTWAGDTVYTALEIANGDFWVFNSSEPVSSGTYRNKKGLKTISILVIGRK